MRNYPFTARHIGKTHEGNADLNSDGKVDNIKVKRIDKTYDFILKINESEIKGNIGDTINGFILVDINKIE